MSSHPIRGKRIVFEFRDGQMAGAAYVHAFHTDGTVSFGMAKGDEPPQMSAPVTCEIAKLRDDVYAASYLSDKGYTLTTVLDPVSHKLIGFASNEKELSLQHGKFTILPSRASSPAPSA